MPRPARVHADRSPDGRMTLAEHLHELRRRVIISVLSILVLTIGQTLGGSLRRTALLAPRGRSYGSGPDDFYM